MSPRSFAVVLASSFAAIALMGCSVDPARNPTPRCENDSECVGGGRCYRGYCLTEEEEAGPPDSGIDAPGADAYRDDANVDAFGDANPPPDGGTDAFVLIMCTMAEECDDGDTCSGVEACTDNVCVGVAEPDGAECDVDENIATRDICVAAACAPTRCGDGYTDAAETEECDDANDVNGDGCEDCRFTCTVAADCSDGVECNGDEICTGAHLCVDAVTPPPDGTACGDGAGTCQDGSCMPTSCALDEECNDMNACNGVETCGGVAGCVPGTAPDCGDADTCTDDVCIAPAGMCQHRLIDADGDGYSPDTGPTAVCGTDCDDGDPDVNEDAVDICGDGIDNNCDDRIDEDADTAWFVDCDGDGYAATGARTVTACVAPPPGSSMCATGGGWTARPFTTSADCNDTNAAVNPGQTTFQTTAITGAAAGVDFDYNCDGSEQRRTTAGGSCPVAGLGCSLNEGWMGGAPLCGANGNWVRSCTYFLGCTANTEVRTQGCL